LKGTKKTIMAQKWLAIVNPVSGGNKNEKQSAIIISHLQQKGINPEIKTTHEKGSAIQLTKEGIENGHQNIIVIGGDGTLNEVINGVMLQQAMPSSAISIAMFSLGTGNDFIRTFGISKNHIKTTEMLLQGNTKTIDVGWVQYQNNNKTASRYFINVLGMAFDGAVTESANSTKGAIGKLTYLKSVVATLFKYEPTTMRVLVDDKEVANETLFCLNIGNCKYSGGGMRMVPDALPDDGLFDITLMRPLPTLTALGNLHRLFNGTIYKLKEATHLRGKKLTVYSNPPICAEAEGEFLGWSTFEVAIIPKAIKIMVP
jgi:YegS/Rv2252/BmrU family lipid kinase